MTSIRPRRADDEAALEALAARVRDEDGYPPRVPNLFSDPITLAAWVAVLADEVVGHVALNERTADEVMDLAAAHTGRPPGRLVAVARLLVDPRSRRMGIGRALLAAAAGAAAELGRHPILDVAEEFHAANALYRRCGWVDIGTVSFTFADGDSRRVASSVVYVGPTAGE